MDERQRLGLRLGGSELGTIRKEPVGSDLYQIARCIEEYGIEGILLHRRLDCLFIRLPISVPTRKLSGIQHSDGVPAGYN